VTIIHSQDSTSHSSVNLQSRPMSARATTVTTLVVSAWTVVVALTLPAFSVGEAIFGVISPVVGFGVGAWQGFGLGFGIVVQLFSGPIMIPAASAAMLGAAAGILSGWLGRAYFRKQDKFSKSFISSLFSSKILEGNAAGFVCNLVVSTATGLGLSLILSSVGVFNPATEIGQSWQVILGGGSGGPFDEGFIGALMALSYMLGALVVACGIAGLCMGGMLGGLIGAGFSTIGAPAFISGASEGLAFRFFAPYRPEDARSGRVIYFLVGAGVGAAEGVIVGFGTGAVFFIAQVASISG
jgi:hypothetical protein